MLTRRKRREKCYNKQKSVYIYIYIYIVREFQSMASDPDDALYH